MRKLMASLALLSIVLLPVNAEAKDKKDKQRDDRSTHSDGKCKGAETCNDQDFSPSFDKSPVQDSFNPVICLPTATCNFGDGQQDTPPDQTTPQALPFRP